MIYMQRSLAVILIISMLVWGVPFLPSQPTFQTQIASASTDTGTTPQVSVGDRIRFGSYNQVPIIWRVIHLDEQGDPLLFAEQILSLKAYDAAGNYHAEQPLADLYPTLRNLRVDNGSNYWQGSNLRQWLNEQAQSISWTQNQPNADQVASGNPYENEKGFLANGNFTALERKAIKSTTHRVLISGYDYFPLNKGTGTENHTYNQAIDTVVQNYDTTARYEQVTDQVLLLSVKQLKEYVYDRGYSITAKPTAAAVAQSSSKPGDLSTDLAYPYWLNTPQAGVPQYVRFVGTDDQIRGYRANYGLFGVRPAVRINLAELTFRSGDGTSETPYIVEHLDTSPPTAPASLNNTDLQSTGVSISWTASTDNVSVAQYEIYNGSVLLGTTVDTTYTVRNLTPGTSYYLRVVAKDDAGNRSANSPQLRITPSVLNIGDYVRFGSYMNAPIIWRVIHLDKHGDPLLFSERVITRKAFDAAGPFHSSYPSRQTNGSNLWLRANVRQWLNSSDAKVTWWQNAPSTGNVTANPYHLEKGFLALGSFTADERGAIKPQSRNVVLAEQDVALKDGGSQTLETEENIEDAVRNYDSTAYYQTVNDRVFLLSVKELKEYVSDRGWDVRANPTAALVSATNNPELMNTESYLPYTLSTPKADESAAVRIVTESGDIGSNLANDGLGGIRPALFLNLSASMLQTGGAGTVNSPYSFKMRPALLNTSLRADNKVLTMTFSKKIANASKASSAAARANALRAAISMTTNAQAANPSFSALQPLDTFKISGTTLSITFQTPLSSSANRIRISPDALQDASGIKAPGMDSHVIAADQAAPAIVSSRITPNNKAIEITFDENLVRAAIDLKANVKWSSVAGDPSYQALSADDKVTLSKNVLTVQFKNVLTGANHRIQILAGTLKDVAGNLTPEGSTDGLTADSTGPTLTGVKVSTDRKTVTLEWNEPLFHTSTAKTASVRMTALRAAVTFSTNWSEETPGYRNLLSTERLTVSGNRLIILLPAALTGQTNRVKISADSLRDLAGNKNLTIETVTF